MFTYSGFEWLLIDLSSRYGKTAKTYMEHISWAQELLPDINVPTMEELKENLKPWIKEAKDKPHFVGAVIAIWDTLQGNPTNWMVSQDSASSGAQLMSCMTKCQVGMSYTGVLGEEIPNLYNTVNDFMGEQGSKLPRKILKEGMIPHMYASTAAPKMIFGKNYPIFLKAYSTAVPRAQILSDQLVDAWNSNATKHVVIAPDGFVADMPVIVENQRKKIPFLKHTYTYVFSAIGKKQKGKAAGTKALSANTIHIYDGYVLRELNRRCDYDEDKVINALRLLSIPSTGSELTENGARLKYLEGLSEEFNQISIVALEYLDEDSVMCISEGYKSKLKEVINQMLMSNSFKIKNVHDDFACLPNYVTHMKYIYNTLLRETYLGRWVFAILTRLTGKHYSVPPVDMNIANEILQAPYSIS